MSGLLRIVLGVAWILLASRCDMILSGGDSSAVRLTAAAGLVLPVVLWVAWVEGRLRRLDEMLGRIEVAGLVWGLVGAVLLEVATHAVFRWLDLATPGFIVLVAPLAFTLSQIHAQLKGREMGRAEP